MFPRKYFGIVQKRSNSSANRVPEGIVHQYGERGQGEFSQSEKRGCPGVNRDLISKNEFFHSSQKGSILLYVLFLTSFLILFFAGFQKEITKTLQKTIATENSVRDQSTIEDALVGLKGHPTVSVEDLPSDISLTSIDYSLTSLSGSLGYDEIREYWITAAGGGPLSLTISEGGPMFYRLAAFNSGSESSATIIGSGLVSSMSSISLGLTDRHILTIESLGGKTKYALTKNGASIMASSNFYSLLNSINGSTKSEEVVEVMNFLPKSYPGIDYMKLGMYLKQE